VRYFPLLDFQYLVLAVFLGIVAVILLYISFGWPGPSGREQQESERYPDGLQAEKNPVPPLLVFVYGAFLVWAVAYMVVVGIRGAPF